MMVYSTIELPASDRLDMTINSLTLLDKKVILPWDGEGPADMRPPPSQLANT
jgi:hypothetical protein